MTKKDLIRMTLGVAFTVMMVTSIVFAGCAPAAPKPAPEGKPLVIGVTQALSGAWAKYGEDEKMATELAVDEINAAGGILGRPLEVIFKDDQANPEFALRNAKDLVLSQNVDWLQGPNSTACVLAVSMFAKEQKVLHFGHNSGAPTTESQGHRYHFGLRANSHYVGLSGGYAAEHFLPDANKWAFLMPDYEYGHSLAEGFWANYTTLVNPGAELVGEFWYPHPECTDFAPFIAKILASGCDAVYQSMTGAAMATFAKQSAGFEYHKQVGVISAEYGQPELTMGIGEASYSLDGAIGGAYYPFWGLDNKMNEHYYKAFYERYGIYPGCVGAMSYMNTLLMKDVIEDVGEFDTEKIIDALEGRKIATTFGDIELRACDHNLMLPYYYGVMKYEPAKWPFPYLTDMWYLDPYKGCHTCEEIAEIRAEQ